MSISGFPSKREAPVCADGDTKEMDCNKCLCSGGQWACTLAFCINSAKVKKRETYIETDKEREHEHCPFDRDRETDRWTTSETNKETEKETEPQRGI